MTSSVRIPDAPFLDEAGNITPPWLQLFTIWGNTILAARQSGATAARPTVGLYVSRPYFDTTLGKPIWVKQVNPSVVWVDATGVAA